MRSALAANSACVGASVERASPRHRQRRRRRCGAAPTLFVSRVACLHVDSVYAFRPLALPPCCPPPPTRVPRATRFPLVFSILPLRAHVCRPPLLRLHSYIATTMRERERGRLFLLLSACVHTCAAS